MKDALDKEGLKPYLMVQILGWHAPEVEDQLDGYMTLPESPFGKLDIKTKTLELAGLLFSLTSTY